jgi:hypothetical protein
MDVRTTCTERQTDCRVQNFLLFKLLTTVNVNMLKWYGHVLCTASNRRTKRILTSSPKGRKGRGRPVMKWQRKMKRTMKQLNLTPEDAVNRQVWRKVSEKQ